MEKSLWDKIVETVRPIKNRKERFGKKIPKVNVRKKSDFDDVIESVSFIGVEDVAKCRIVKNILEPDISIGDASRIDKHVKRNIDKKFVPDARLDLHGKTLENGYRLFVSFVNKNFEVGNRCLLVVTGKGTPSRGTGVIKQSLPQWLLSDDVASKILYVTYAKIEDGGDGAVYILLRK